MQLTCTTLTQLTCNSAAALSRYVPQSRHLRARQAVTLALFSLLMLSFLLPSCHARTSFALVSLTLNHTYYVA